MSKLRNRKLYIAAALICISFFLTSIAFALAACGIVKKPSDDADYYLSLASRQWQTYNSAESIPDDVHFESSGNNLYTLEITLNAGEQFTVNQTGSDDKIGFDSLFSSGDDLVRGDNGSMKVNHAGTFVLSYYVDDNTITYSYTAQAASVKIITTDTNLFVGDKYPFKAVVVYSNGEEVEESVVWTSSNTEILSVDKDGIVSALAKGTATLTATAHGISSAALSITVKLSSVPVTGVILDAKELAMDLGEEHGLQATVQPEDADDQRVIWQSSNESAVMVSQDGTLTAVGYGTAVITVTTVQNSYKDTCNVTVVKHVTSMRFSSEELTIVAGGKTKELGLVFLPSDATYKDVDITVTSGANYAEIITENGGYAIRGLAEGAATITATLKENPEIIATCSVSVLAAGTELASMSENVTAMIGEPTTLTVSLESGEIESVEWSVENDAVATVSGEGAEATVTGVDFGSTVVTAKVTAVGGNIYTATSNVLVSDEWYFIYGYNLGASGYWDWEDYLTDRNAAEQDGVLLIEQSRGIYTLTGHFTPDQGFQIIFPKVGNYTQHDDMTDEDVWSKNIPSHWVAASHYYSSANSTPQYVSNATEYFCVNAAGVYTVTLDLTGTSAKVGIKMVSLDVTDVQLSLTEGNYVLGGGDEATITFTVSPSNADYAEEGVRFFFTSDYADYKKYLTCTLNFAEHTLQLTAGEAPETFTATLHLSVNGVEQILEFNVLSVNDKKVPVTEISFEQEKYEFNVNNGLGNWTTTVKALTNDDATNGQVRYYDVTDYDELLSHPSDERAIVDPVTGEVTARSLGTLKIKAVSLDDPSVEATVEVLFYSDQIYLVGDSFGRWVALSQNETMVSGPHAPYVFTKISNTKYTYHLDSVHVGDQDGKFKIVFLGMDEQWTGQINYANVVYELGNAVCDWSGDYCSATGLNIVFLSNAAYDLTLDLSMHKPMLIIDRPSRLTKAEDYVFDFNGSTKLKMGDTATARLFKIPFETFSEEEVNVSYTGNENGYLSHTYDAQTNTLTFTARKQEYADEDKTVTVSITAGETTNELTFTIVAKHHFELKWDSDGHWLECTDAVCTDDENCKAHIKDKEAHQKTGLEANAEGHFYACSGCGIETLGFEAHECKAAEGKVYDFSEEVQKCDICHADLFKIEGNTLVYYYYDKAETVAVPEEVTIIGAHAFEGHDEIATLTYSTKVSKIEAYAFAGCSSLKSLSMTNYLETIGDHAFAGITATLRWGHNPRITAFGTSFAGYCGSTVEIPKTVRVLGAQCFEDSKIESIVLPDTLTGLDEVKMYTFRNCTELKYVEIGKSCSSFAMFVFENCTSLETVIIHSERFFRMGQGVFKNCISLKGVYFERPLSTLLSCGQLINETATGGSSKELLGKCYAYSDVAPEEDPFGEAKGVWFGLFRDYFAGCWHWDNSGEKDLENILLWNDEGTETPLPAALPALINDKRGYPQA